MIIQKNILVLHAIKQFAKLFNGYFSVTGETTIERKLCDLRVSVVNSYTRTINQHSELIKQKSESLRFYN